MSYYNAFGDLVENEHDEKMTRKYGNNYRYVKSLYPQTYKLPQEEVSEMVNIARWHGNTLEEGQQALNKYIKKNEPMWQQTYFKPQQQQTTQSVLNPQKTAMQNAGQNAFQPQVNQPKQYAAPTGGTPQGNMSAGKSDDQVYFHLSGYPSVKKFKNGYPDYEKDLPNISYQKLGNSVLENDCLISDRYNDAINTVLQNEGGYVKDLNKIDQETNMGIRKGFYEKLLRKNPKYKEVYPEELKDLTSEQVKNIYCQEFYKKMKGEFIKNDRLRRAIIDQSVLRGQEDATKSLQQELNRRGHKVAVDRALGSETLRALNQLENPDEFLENYKPQLEREICNDPKYNNGWRNRINRY